ncbi:hypothetical protein FFF34_015180 [Inquilinus sp. KBS0705]|nr:hypothetical protein FFF34_015180 [Inquilinus sp. KBS0705]
MKVDNPNAYRFILEDEIYLLEKDKVSRPQPVPQPVAPTPVIEIKTPDVVFNYMGKNNKAFLILVNYSGEQFIPAAHLTALENILKGKQLGLDDVAIFNLNNYADTGIDQLTQYFKPAKLLVLGQNAMPNGISTLTLNQPTQIGGIAALYSFGFDDMMDNVANKKAFWEQMKKL